MFTLSREELNTNILRLRAVLDDLERILAVLDDREDATTQSYHDSEVDDGLSVTTQSYHSQSNRRSRSRSASPIARNCSLNDNPRNRSRSTSPAVPSGPTADGYNKWVTPGESNTFPSADKYGPH